MFNQFQFVCPGKLFDLVLPFACLGATGGVFQINQLDGTSRPGIAGVLVDLGIMLFNPADKIGCDAGIQAVI